MAAQFAQILISAKDGTRPGFDAVAANLQGLENRADRANASLRTLGTSAATSLRSVAVGLSAGLGVSEIAKASDAFSTLNAQLKISVGSASGAAVAYGEVFRIAQASGQSLEQVAGVYRKFSDSAADLGIGQKQVADATETIAQAMALSGGSAESAQAALTQFGQALSSGTLRGEELNSVLEQAPRLARAIADGLGVPVGKLRELAGQGLITSQALVEALRSQKNAIAEEFEALPVTVGRSLTNLQNAFINTVGSFEQSTGVFGASARALDVVAKNFDTVAAGATVLASIMAGRLVAGLAAATAAKIAAASEARNLAAAELAAAQAAQAASVARAAGVLSTGSLTAATTRLAAAQTAVAASSRLAGVIGFLGGPLGVVTTALSLGATAWALWGKSANDAVSKTAAGAEESTQDIVRSLDKQIEKLRERNRVAAAGLPTLAQTGGPAADRVGEIQTRMDAIRNRTGIYSNTNDVAQSALLEQAGLELAGILSRLKEVGEEQKKLDDFGKQTAAGKWLEKYATNAEQLAAELKKAKAELGSAFTPELEGRIREKFAVKAPKANSTRMRQEAQQMLDEWSPLELRWNLEAKDFEGGANADLKQWQAASEERLDDLVAKYKDIADPAEKYRREIELVTALEIKGRLTAEEAFKVRGKLIEEESRDLGETNKKLKEGKSFAEEFGLTMTSAFEDAIVGGKGLSEVFQGLSRDIARFIVRSQITNPLGEAISGLDFKSVGSDIGGFFGGLFGGPRAVGGGVEAGKIYEVNEQSGPGELLTANGRTFLMANQNGYVTPTRAGAAANDSSAPGGNVTVIQHISVDARSDMASIQSAMIQAKEMAKSEILSSLNRGGQFARVVGKS